jgi:hypothetical protein
MKTDGPLPNEVFRSLEASLETNEIDPLTEAINRVVDCVDTRLDPGLKRLQETSLERNGHWIAPRRVDAPR